MLIRAGSGSSGIKEYLEEGQKKDRFFSRDELDERLILKGNLDQTNDIINAIPDDGTSRYFHYTLAFQEHHISPETLQNIADDFEQFIKTAYGDNELEFYAEAHLPKIKSFTKANGESVERMPHIHVVIPKVNLADGKSYDPLVDKMIEHINAFQEVTNAKYGLASPKDNYRFEFTDSSEFISRYKGDIFNAHNREHKAELLKFVLDKNPTNQLELYEQLQQAGYNVKLRNAGKPEQSYINITFKGDSKGINLKDSVFRDSFLALPLDKKTTFLSEQLTVKYREAHQELLAKNEYQSKFKEWNDFKAYETRYLPNLSENQTHKYNTLSDANKQKYMLKLHQQTLNKLQQLTGENNDGIEPITAREFYHATREVGRNVERAERNSSNLAGIDTEQARGRFRELTNRTNSAEHRADIEFSNTDSRKPKQSSIDEIKQEFNRDNALTKTDFTLKELNQNIRADVLLEMAEKTHGVNSDIYEITVDKNGNDRIKCGSRNLNIVDFVTKELNLSFKQTIPYLTNVLHMQNDVYRSKGFDQSKQYLQQEYKAWNVAYKEQKQNTVKQLEHTYRTQKSLVNQNLTRKINDIRIDVKLSQQQKTFEINLAKSEKILALKKLQFYHQKQLSEVKKQFNTDMQMSYRNFLAEHANKGDEEALEELKRLRLKYDPESNSIKTTGKYEQYILDIKYNIDANGYINYTLDDKIIIRDTGSRIDVFNSAGDNAKLSLELAIMKFGNELDLSGSDDFKKQLVETAIKNNMKVTFIDEFSKQYAEQYRQKILSDTQQLNKTNSQFLQSQNSDRYLYLSTQAANILSNDNRVKSVNIHTIKNMNTNEVTQVSNSGLDYMYKDNKLEAGQVFDTKLADGKVKFTLTKDYVLRKEIKAEILATRAEKFHGDNLAKYGKNDQQKNIEGVFLKIATNKYNQEQVVIKTSSGIQRINDTEAINKFKELKPETGSKIILAVVDTKDTPKTTTKKSINIDKADKYINFTDLQLLADLSVPATKNKLIKESMGEVIDSKHLKINNQDLYKTTIKDQYGKLQSYYLPSALNKNDFVYIKQSTNKTYDIVNLTQEKQAMEAQNKLKLSEQENIQSVDFGSLAKIGYREIRGKDVFFADIQCVEDGKATIIRKHGEAIKDSIINNNIQVGASIALLNQVDVEHSIEKSLVIEIIELDKDIEHEIDNRLAEMQKAELIHENNTEPNEYEDEYKNDGWER